MLVMQPRGPEFESLALTSKFWVAVHVCNFGARVWGAETGRFLGVADQLRLNKDHRIWVENSHRNEGKGKNNRERYLK